MSTVVTAGHVDVVILRECRTVHVVLFEIGLAVHDLGVRDRVVHRLPPFAQEEVIFRIIFHDVPNHG